MIYFSLFPINEEVIRFTNDSHNASFKKLDVNGDPCLQIGDGHTSKSRGNLVSFGRDRSTSDLYLGSSRSYSGTHCYIYIHPVSGEFVLQDKSDSKTTLEVAGDHEKRYTLQGDPRRRVLPRDRDTRIRCWNAIFKIWWHNPRFPLEQQRVCPESSIVARTTFEKQSAPPPVHETRVLPPKLLDGVQLLEKIDHQVRRHLGSGGFGQVSLTVNLHSGNLLAVKQISVPPENEKQAKEEAKKEALLISKPSHKHVAAFVHSQGWGRGQMVELFMTPYDGSLRDLMCKDLTRGPRGEPHFYETLKTQMLEALDFLRRKQVVHCDIKPENILHNGGGKSFYLADFGLSNSLANADSQRGTFQYMAPEAFEPGKLHYKADIWSLGVTLLEVVRPGGLGRFVGENMSEYFRDPRNRATYHRNLMFAAQQYRPELLPMLQRDLTDRFDAKNCMLEFSGATQSIRARQMSWEYAPLDLPNTPATAETIVPLNLTLNSRTGDRPVPQAAMAQHPPARSEQLATAPLGPPRCPPNTNPQRAPLQELVEHRNQPVEDQSPGQKTPRPSAQQGMAPGHGQQNLFQEHGLQQTQQASNWLFANQNRAPHDNLRLHRQRARNPQPMPPNQPFTIARENQPPQGLFQNRTQDGANAEGVHNGSQTAITGSQPQVQQNRPTGIERQCWQAAGPQTRRSDWLRPPLRVHVDIVTGFA